MVWNDVSSSQPTFFGLYHLWTVKTIILILFPFVMQAQSTIKLMTYNLLNYEGLTEDTLVRNPYFRTVMLELQPTWICFPRHEQHRWSLRSRRLHPRLWYQQRIDLPEGGVSCPCWSLRRSAKGLTNKPGTVMLRQCVYWLDWRWSICRLVVGHAPLLSLCRSQKHIW